MQAARRWRSRWQSGRGHGSGCEPADYAGLMSVGELLARLQRLPRDVELPAMEPECKQD